jgi:diaminohydroxyphosphoribosylaminopyrimidine deaminase/5-amino-6-(5-phosphoribosylamino)uracil reductase
MSLERALALAEEARGRGYPNPTVGAVLVDADGALVGEGVSEPAGGPHAEVLALERAGDGARGGTLFVSMEPCAHHCRTPPCVDAILAAGVARVVAGCADPSPDAGGGADALRAAGVEVELLDLAEARRQNEAWRTWAAQGRPHVVLKLAVSVDGRVVVPGRRWVTGEPARRRVHELRAEVDAVAVGMGTVRVDAPRPAARRIGARAPQRPARRGARRARCRRRPVASPRGRPDARDRLPRARPRRPPARPRGAGAGGRRPAHAHGAPRADRAG